LGYVVSRSRHKKPKPDGTGGVGLTSFTVTAVIVLILAAAALHAAGKRIAGCWLLVLLPASLCGWILHDLSLGAKRLGEAAVEGDRHALAFLLFWLSLSLIAALRPSWRWLFWIAWTLDAFVCGILIYMVFFWKVFG
jgi:hypothetical protein